MSDVTGVWLDHADTLDQEAEPGPWFLMGPDDTNESPVARTVQPGIAHDVEKADAEWIVHTRTAMPKAATALREVRELHAPKSWTWGGVEVVVSCQECSGTVPHPCPTIMAIDKALGHE